MQLGFVSAILYDRPLNDVLAIAAAEGYDCVEVMCWPASGPDRKFGGVCHIDVEGFTQSKADDVGALCEKHGVTISGLGYYSNPLAADDGEAERARTHFKKVIDAAPLLGLGIVNSFIGAHTKLSLDENLERFTTHWPNLVRHAEDRGVRIGIENCPMLFANTWPFGMNLAQSPAIWRRMFEIIPSASFGLNYDPSHLAMQLIDPIAPIREFGPRIFHTHAKDMRIERDKLNDVGTLALPMSRSTAKLPGRGEIDWRRWIGALREAGYNGAVCVEVEDEEFTEQLDDRKRSLALSREALRPVME